MTDFFPETRYSAHAEPENELWAGEYLGSGPSIEELRERYGADIHIWDGYTWEWVG